jgi:hypothetical protein
MASREDIAEFLLQKGYLLTALEFYQELLEDDGTELESLKEYFIKQQPNFETESPRYKSNTTQHNTTHDSRLTTHDSRLTTHDSRLTTHNNHTTNTLFTINLVAFTRILYNISIILSFAMTHIELQIGGELHPIQIRHSSSITAMSM